MLNVHDFKQYRTKIGFANQNDLKIFLSAKDIKSIIDYSYIDSLNIRICEIIKRLNHIVHQSITIQNIDEFCKTYIDKVYKILKTSNLLPRLNNQGRRPEQVYFSWMRGQVISQFFTKALALIFEVEQSSIKVIGNDNINDIENFKRQPTADLQIEIDEKIIQIEIQSGYQGINDIKQHKVLQGKRQFIDKQIRSLVIHFDLFNGQVAFVDISNINDNDINWITRQQMEGQTVFNISQQHFIWSLSTQPPKLKDIQEFILE